MVKGRTVGPAPQARLRAIGCFLVADVRDLSPRRVRQGMTVVGERIVHELRGECCLDLFLRSYVAFGDKPGQNSLEGRAAHAWENEAVI